MSDEIHGEAEHYKAGYKEGQDDALETARLRVDAERAKHAAELATLREANARLEAAVRELGKCGTCEGYGEYPIDETDPHDTMAVCSTCHGAKMHRTAISALAPPRAEPARLDPDGTATGKTILTAPVVSSSKTGIGTMYPGPASTHVDLETGKRTGLVHSQPTVPKVAIDHAPACDAPPERPRVGYRCRCGAVGYRIATPQPTGPRERTPVCPGPDCLACNGEACELCGAGMGNTDPSRPRCEHGTIERHTQPTGDGQVKP